MADATPYERSQLDAIRRWKNQDPGLVGRAATGAIALPLWLARRMLSEGAIRRALELAQVMAVRLVDEEDLLRLAGAARGSDLGARTLQELDLLADRVQGSAAGWAAAAGAFTGVTGLPGLAADIPSLLTLAFRTIYRIGLCYGFRPESDSEFAFALGVLAAAAAGSRSEKRAALAALEVHGQQPAAAGQPADLDQVARILARTFARRKALQVVPGIGAVVGGSVNGWFMREVGWAARRGYQERWLRGRGVQGVE